MSSTRPASRRNDSAIALLITRSAGAYMYRPKHPRLMKPKTIVMHPLPRLDEIAMSVDSTLGRPTSARPRTASMCAWPCWPWSWQPEVAPPLRRYAKRLILKN